VRVRLCPISVCEAHPYEQCTHPNTKNFMKALSEWGKITDTLYIWHYNTDFANYLMPFPDFGEFPADLKLYKKSGVKGVFFEGAYNTFGASDAELRSYVMAKCLWNEQEDADKLVTEWMQGVYGKGWQPMRQWFDLLHEKVKPADRHFFIYDGPSIHYLAGDTLAKGDQLFDQAQKLTVEDRAAWLEIQKARLWLRYVKIAQGKSDQKEIDEFVKACRYFKITMITEGQGLDAWAAAHKAK